MLSFTIWSFIGIALFLRCSADARLFDWLFGRRSASVNPAVSSRPRSCFRQYFLGGYIPEELEINFNDTPSADIRYICQTRDNIFTESYYATLYDEKYGVPVYSGYRIGRSQARNIDTISYRQRPRSSAWQTTPGIGLQGDNAMYAGSSSANIHRGHLNPCQINSYNRSFMFGTFLYTNSVPQCGSSFNSGSWMRFEKKIKNYTRDVCAGTLRGTMYLVTGQSRYRISVSSSGAISQVVGGAHYFPPGAPTQILQPNALWTAGCCVYRYTSSRTGITSTRAESIAVMGNNDMRSHCTLTRALDLATLETLIVAPGAIPADIFPGNHDCARNSGSHYL
ncbi:uncharacterized protein [Acropora muricata]|uniref:uncharacterized protein LOC114956564 n=1 Tax=Acropora millepora TaxID=45264 RepID=UPI001CF52DDE|nr:uncharacterized protein LOC114956564 [Acropora millepora]